MRSRYRRHGWAGRAWASSAPTGLESLPGDRPGSILSSSATTVSSGTSGSAAAGAVGKSWAAISDSKPAAVSWGLEQDRCVRDWRRSRHVAPLVGRRELAGLGKPGRLLHGRCRRVVVGAERLDCFVVGNDRHLYHKRYSGGWSGWEDLGGNIYSNPAAVSWSPNRIDVFAIGGDHAMWHRWWDGASW